MTKQELIAAIATETGLSKAAAARALEALLQVSGKALKKDRRLYLAGFGTFKVSTRQARKGRNPQTGKEIKVAARKVVKFKAGFLAGGERGGGGAGQK